MNRIALLAASLTLAGLALLCQGLPQRREALGVDRRADLGLHDRKGLVDGEGIAIRALRGKRIENVGGSDDPGLQRDLGATKLPRVAGAVELLVMRDRDLGDVAQRAAPRDLTQEVVGVRDVAVDLEPLVVGQRASADLERADLAGVEEIRRAGLSQIQDPDAE